MAIAMKRKDAPQVRATAEVMPHSVGPNFWAVSRPRFDFVTCTVLPFAMGNGDFISLVS
jgi:hypothetical protein